MKTNVLKDLIVKFQKFGAKEFRSSATGMKEPRSFSFYGNRKSFTPDLVAIYPNKRDIISVENKIVKSELPDLIAKWILFALEARKAGGSFYLVVDEKSRSLCDDIIVSKKLSVELLTY